MSWIVNILATLIYLGFGIIYAVGFSKRKHFRYSIVVTAAAIFLAQAGMFLLFQVENWSKVLSLQQKNLKMQNKMKLKNHS